MMKSDTEMFLDDYNVTMLESKLGTNSTRSGARNLYRRSEFKHRKRG